jgi:hypothetical protein
MCASRSSLKRRWKNGLRRSDPSSRMNFRVVVGICLAGGAVNQRRGEKTRPQSIKRSVLEEKEDGINIIEMPSVPSLLLLLHLHSGGVCDGGGGDAEGRGVAILSSAAASAAATSSSGIIPLPTI